VTHHSDRKHQRIDGQISGITCFDGDLGPTRSRRKGSSRLADICPMPNVSNMIIAEGVNLWKSRRILHHGKVKSAWAIRTSTAPWSTMLPSEHQDGLIMKDHILVCWKSTGKPPSSSPAFA